MDIVTHRNFWASHFSSENKTENNSLELFHVDRKKEPTIVFPSSIAWEFTLSQFYEWNWISK